MPAKPLATADVMSVGSVRVSTIAKRTGRTLDSVRWQLHKQGIRPQHEATKVAGMSAADVAAALGVHISTIYRWAERGYLRAHKGQGLTTAFHSFDAEDVSAFIASVGGLMPCLKPEDVEPVWREEVELARTALHARYVCSVDIFTALCLPRQQQCRMQRRFGFPAAVWRLGAYGDWFEREEVRTWLAAHPRYQTSASRSL